MSNSTVAVYSFLNIYLVHLFVCFFLRVMGYLCMYLNKACQAAKTAVTIATNEWKMFIMLQAVLVERLSDACTRACFEHCRNNVF